MTTIEKLFEEMRNTPHNLSCPSKCEGCPCIHCKYYRAPKQIPVDPAHVTVWHAYYCDGDTPYCSHMEIEASSEAMAEIIAKITLGDKYDRLVEFFIEDHFDFNYLLP